MLYNTFYSGDDLFTKVGCPFLSPLSLPILGTSALNLARVSVEHCDLAQQVWAESDRETLYGAF